MKPVVDKKRVDEPGTHHHFLTNQNLQILILSIYSILKRCPGTGMYMLKCPFWFVLLRWFISTMYGRIHDLKCRSLSNYFKKGYPEVQLDKFKLRNRSYYIELQWCLNPSFKHWKRGLFLWTQGKLTGVSHTFLDGQLVTMKKLSKKLEQVYSTIESQELCAAS